MEIVSRRSAAPAVALICPLSLFLVLAGCASYSPKDIVKPSEITLDKALQDVVTSLHRAQDRYPPEQRLGLIADQVEVNFEVAASAGNSGTQTLNLANIPVGGTGGALGGSLEGQQSSNANRGNTIKIIFKNRYTADMSKGLFLHSAKASAAEKRGAAGMTQAEMVDDVIQNSTILSVPVKKLLQQELDQAPANEKRKPIIR